MQRAIVGLLQRKDMMLWLLISALMGLGEHGLQVKGSQHLEQHCA